MAEVYISAFIMEKKMKERIQIKHDTAQNWAKAVNFTPLAGELIIYDGVLENGIYIEQPRIKIGDGVHKLAELPFMSVGNNESKASYEYDIKNKILEIK